jgi:hypothetical protein
MKATTIALATVLALFTTTQAAYILTTTGGGTSSQAASGSGGGGGGGIGPIDKEFIIPPFESRSRMETSGRGWNQNAQLENQDQQTHSHEHVDDQTGEIWTHEWTEPKQGSVNVWGRAVNGELSGQNFVFYDADVDVRWRNDNRYDVDWDIKVLLTSDEVVDWIEPGNIGSSNEGGILLGPEYNIQLDIRHETLHWHDDDDNCHDEQTRNLVFDIWAWFKDCEVSDLRTEVGMFSYWYDEVQYNGVNFSGSFNADWVPIPDIVLPIITEPVIIIAPIENPFGGGATLSFSESTNATPEPATMILLAVCAPLTMRRRRRR